LNELYGITAGAVQSDREASLNALVDAQSLLVVGQLRGPTDSRDELYEELRAAAAAAKRPATKFAQDLMRAGLDEWRRERRQREIAAYARQVAGTSEDLDPELERAGMSAIRGNER